MKRFALVLTVLVLFVSITYAQTIEPIWEYLITDDSSPLPILKKNVPTPNEVWDSTDLYDSYGGLKRYDDTRLLLAIRENGIDESDPNHDAALAAQFPDRSLIWINPADGSPMGIALVIGLTPVAMDPTLLAAGGSTLDYYYSFGVSDDGVIYSGHKNRIFKYEPRRNGTFSDPVIVYTHPNDGTDTWAAWRWETFKVQGSGTNTVILAGGKTWRTNQKYYYLTTTDGNTFAPTTDQIDYRGGASSPYLSPSGEELWVIGGHFPGGASGFGVNIFRFFTVPDGSAPFLNDDFFTFTAPAVDLAAQNYLNTYIGWFLSGFDAKTGLPHFAVFSTPSWDTKDDETAGALGTSADPSSTPYLPGWLALHDATTGAYIEGSAHMLNVLESDELDGDTTGLAEPGSRWHGTLGDVELNVLPNAAPGAAELLWYSGIYGYGRYAIGDLGEPTSVPNWDLF